MDSAFMYLFIAFFILLEFLFLISDNSFNYSANPLYYPN